MYTVIREKGSCSIFAILNIYILTGLVPNACHPCLKNTTTIKLHLL